MSHTQTAPQTAPGASDDATEATPKQRDIAEAATRLFIEQGYAPVSMDAIARAAGVSKATLYSYFASKERLFANLVGVACSRSGAALGPLADGSADLRATLTELGNRALRYLLQKQSLAIYRVVMAESARFPELGRVFYESGAAISRRSFAAWVERQMAAGKLVARDPGLAAEQFMGLLRTHLHMRALLGIGPPPTEAEIETTVAAAVETFLRAYTPSTPATSPDEAAA